MPKTHDPYYSEELIIPISFVRNNNLSQNNQIKWRYCKHCKLIKPLRTHHCSLCGSCVMKMDHHCPWINNCVGQNNHRYFLLFPLHVFCYTILGLILVLPIMMFKKKVSIDINKIISRNNFNMKEVKFLGVLGIYRIFI